jgi:hypothetical protein
MFGLFSDNDAKEEQGCGGHHFEEYEHVRYRTEVSYPRWSGEPLVHIKADRQATCAHEGCKETDMHTKFVRTVALADVMGLKKHIPLPAPEVTHE